ncbi:serine-rich adhesin for platelets isoform X2 [Bactrocera oleae]|uniref:serine-rich adhesin for platelets isoform X2 n=1 Tax=Bactrocera oleae TaxID=104688 RepID=UPI00387E9CF8
MTIKPIISPTQKRAASDEKKETHSHSHTHTPHQHGTHTHGLVHNVVEPINSHSQNSTRNANTHGQCRAGQSPQRRVEVFDDIARHRRSPHKSSRSKRRDHHDHIHKRERVEREKLSTVSVSNNTGSNKCSSPHVHSNVPSSTGAAVNNIVSTPVGKNVMGTSASTATVETVENSADQLGTGSVVLSCQSPKLSTSTTQAAANLLKAVEETYSGYNSGDEHLRPKEDAITADEWQQRDEQFAKCMAGRGYELRPVEEDGACLFRSISLQIYGDEEMHDVVRQHTMDYIYKNREYFSHFVTEDINSYIKRKRRKDSHGNHIEIQAMSEIYNRPVEVYSYKPTPINIFNSEQLNKGFAALRLSYQRGSHYNAILDPYNATVGVGLGLAGHKPDLQTKEAVLLSEQMEIEQTMFEDKLKTTDWEATNEAIEEQIARESYLQWCRENLHKSRINATAASTSATVTSAEVASDSEASPSKYSVKHNNSSDLNTNTSNCSNNSAHTDIDKATHTDSTTKTTKAFERNLSASVDTTDTPPNLEHNRGLSPKSLNIIAHSVNKNTTSPHSVGEWELDSDDTDISSTSSIGIGSGGNSAGNLKVLKKRNANLRAGGKKRRREPVVIAKGKSVAATTRGIGKSPKYENEGDAPLMRSHTPEGEQQPCTSKQSCTTTPEKDFLNARDNLLDMLSASTSKCTLPLSKSSTESSSQSVDNQESSNFYQELLEASYATDGFGQLSESEMLQRAIQLSTQEYIDDQKRKYLFGP